METKEKCSFTVRKLVGNTYWDDIPCSSRAKYKIAFRYSKGGTIIVRYCCKTHLNKVDRFISKDGKAEILEINGVKYSV